MSAADLAGYDVAELKAELSRVESTLAGPRGRRVLTSAEVTLFKSLYRDWLRERIEYLRAELQARGGGAS